MRWICAVAALMALMAPAQARLWKPERETLAQDYAVITDIRKSHDVISVFWLAPPLAPSSPAAQLILERYVIVGVSHVKQDTVTGKTESTNLDAVEAHDNDGKPLTLLEGDKVPPTVAAVITGIGGMARQAMGVTGTGMRFFAFEAGNIRACGKGRLSVVYVGETYTYDTPIPGCGAP
ncbi:MAG TPA: hypothetical protein VN723_06895 [Rhizomicrobium sp.]|nr:hypothetical protein [Rhizomicrobium sp.]